MCFSINSLEYLYEIILVFIKILCYCLRFFVCMLKQENSLSYLFFSTSYKKLQCLDRLIFKEQ